MVSKYFNLRFVKFPDSIGLYLTTKDSGIDVYFDGKGDMVTSVLPTFSWFFERTMCNESVIFQVISHFSWMPFQ